MNFTDKKLFLYNTLFLGNRKFLEETLEGEIKSFFEDPFGENKKTIFYKLSSLQIKVDEIRNIKNFINQTFDGVKIILISSFIWSNEVQNALLKVLEDTPKDTYFYLISQNKYTILPTILSRVFVIRNKNILIEDLNKKTKSKKEKNLFEIAKEILELQNNQRLEHKDIKKILSAKVKTIKITEDDEEENVRKDLELQMEFIENLFEVFSLHFKDLSEHEKKENLKYIKKFQEVEDLIKIEGISLNYFIEFLLLFLPKI
jgi:DNA polymerase III delta prime subunit